jgi:hypothetical protein
VRIVYLVLTESREVIVLMIGNRRDIWERDQSTILERRDAEQSRLSDDPPTGIAAPQKSKVRRK